MRERVKEELIKLSQQYSNIAIELPTGYGKTNYALEIMKEYIKLKENILIVIPRNVLIENWKREIKKWKMEKYLPYITFTTYVSLHKHEGNWDIVIYDEAHHLSERCREALANFNIKRNILLSATIKYSMKDEFREVFSNMYFYKIKVKEAIESNVLPDPTIYLVPLTLDTKNLTETIIKNPKGKTPAILTDWSNRWQFIKQNVTQVHIKCTQWQYYNDISTTIDWFKKKAMGKAIFKNRWLKLCGDRLKWLSDKKTNFLLQLSKHIKKERSIIFCNSIEQSEYFDNCINSKNTESNNILNAFNEGTINHISSINMLNEGINLYNCRIGVFGVINSSEIMIIQKIGRILRHPKPIIIIPYYKNTREEEIVTKIIEDYNPELIKIINNINEIKL